MMQPVFRAADLHEWHQWRHSPLTLFRVRVSRVRVEVPLVPLMLDESGRLLVLVRPVGGEREEPPLVPLIRSAYELPGLGVTGEATRVAR